MYAALQQRYGAYSAHQAILLFSSSTLPIMVVAGHFRPIGCSEGCEDPEKKRGVPAFWRILVRVQQDDDSLIEPLRHSGQAQFLFAYSMSIPSVSCHCRTAAG